MSRRRRRLLVAVGCGLGMALALATPRLESAMENQTANPNGAVVILGASYAEGWKVDRIAGRAVVNRGITGQQSFELAERFERDVVAARPRAVIIWGFINDIYRSSPESAEQALSRMRQSYQRMITLARSNGIEPILATEVTIRPPDTWSETVASWIGGLMGKESYQARVNRHVQAGNQSLIEMAGRERLLLLDFRTALADRHGLRRPEFIQPDGSHITNAGYAALTAYATPVLERHFGGK